MSLNAITHDDIASISCDFWSSMANLPLSSVAVLPEQARNEEGILGRIEIRGAWAGMVEVRASRSLARATAVSLLEKPSAQVTVEECFDAIQEATNIVAGSFKRLLPSICKMGVPAMSGCSSLSTLPPCSQLLAVYFISPNGSLAISVCTQD